MRDSGPGHGVSGNCVSRINANLKDRRARWVKLAAAEAGLAYGPGRRRAGTRPDADTLLRAA